MARMTRLAAAGAVVLFTASGVLAWHAKGHIIVARSAVEMAATAAGAPATSPDSRPSIGPMPEFFRRGVEMIARSSPQPDLFAQPGAPRELRDAEASEHYFDIEMLRRASTQPGLGSSAPPGPSAPVPATRYEFIDWCSRNNVKPARVGFLPYAIVEWTQRLALGLAEHRAFPNDPNVQARCLLYAGILSHYSADLCQPLHTTIHYDGRAKPDGSSPHGGIHVKVDALLGKLRADDLAAALAATAPADEGPGPEAFERLMPAVLAEFARSHALVDKVYELEPRLPNWDEAISKEGAAELIAFAKQRYRRAVIFTASLYMTAWRDSAAINLPPWAHTEIEHANK